MNQIKIIFSILMFVSLLSSASAQNSANRENIENLLELMGSGDIGVQVGEMMIVNFRQSFPDVPPGYWDEFLKELNADALIEKLIPIYEKHYSDEDIKGLIQFYQTPLGQKTIRIMPEIMQESMQVGQVWGAEIGEKIYSDLKEKGLIKE